MPAESSGQRPIMALVRQTLVYGSGYVTMAVANFALVPIYTRRFSPADYGLLGLMLVLYGLMSQLYDFGFTSSVGRFFFDHDGDADGLLTMRATALAFLILLGGALTATLWAAAGEWSQLLTQSSRHADLVRVVGITLYAEGIAIVPLTLMRMQQRARPFVLITLVRFVVTLTLSIVFVVSMNMGVRGALLANALSAVAVLAILLPDYWAILRGRISLPLLRKMLSFGIPFFPVILSAWFIEASDRYLLGIYRSQAEVGYYVLGYKVAQVMQIALSAFSMGWAPLRYRISQQADAASVYRRLTNFYVIAAALLTVALGLVAREAVSLIAPSSYAPAAQIVPLIALGYALNGLYLLMVTGMGVAKKTAPMLWVVGGAAIANVGINIVLIPRWGMHAAAETTVLANAIMAGGGWYYSQRVYPIAYDWRRILTTIGLGAGIVAAVVWLTPDHGVVGIGTAIGAWILFVGLLIMLRIVPGSELARAGVAVRSRMRFGRATQKEELAQ